MLYFSSIKLTVGLVSIFLMGIASGQNSLTFLNKQSYLIPSSSMNQLRGSVFIGGQGVDKSVVVIAVQDAFANHPVHFHVGDCGTGGDIAVSLEPIDSQTGLSVTVLDIPPEVIIRENHYLNIHASSEDLGTIVSCLEIGVNAELANEQLSQSSSTSQRSLQAAEQTETGVRAEEFETLSTAAYGIFSVAGSSVYGQVQVTEQSNDTVNVLVTLEGYESQARYPMDIKAGNCGPEGVTILELNTFPFGLVEPNASLTQSTLPFDSFAKADNFLTVYDQDGTVLACGEVGLGANR